MFENVNLRILVILAVVGFSSYLFYPIEKRIPLGLDLRGGVHIEARIDMGEVAKKMEKRELTPYEQETHLNQAIVVIRERINQTGLLESEVRKGGADRITLQIPGYTNTEDAVKLLTQVGYLEFALVSDDQNKTSLAMKSKKIPGYRLLSMTAGRAGETISQDLLVKEKAEFDGTYLQSSTVTFTQDFNEPQVSLNFNGKGAKLFAAVTRKNVGRRLAIILDDKIVSAPTIQTEIPNGSAVITGSFTLDEAKQLSLILNAGALPAKLEVLSTNQVSASLGKDSIANGTKACIWGLVFVGIFMISYYRLPGAIAVIGLFVNALLILGIMAAFRATMTLPGIAGLILTLGMAVDANVLIYERMREEMKLGKRIKSVIEAGYNKAFLAIFDSNLTTILTGVVLYYCGKGPIKGYAVVLIIGLLASLFSSLYVTRTVFYVMFNFGWIEKIKMMSLVPFTNFKFIEIRKKAYLISFILVVISFVTFFAKGDKKYGIDFTGGDLMELRFEKDVKIEELRSATKMMSGDLSFQYYGSEKQVLVRGKNGQNTQVKAAIKADQFGKYEVTREEQVGPLIGSELRKSAVLATIFSFILMLIYLGMRFELNYGIGAIVAVIHDAVVAVGMTILFGYEINLVTVAAVLTVIGYSVNDTIVIFDRIRETLQTNVRKTKIDIINEAINATLSRTFITTFATMFVVLSILLYGGGSIHEFAVTLFLGMIAGTYSTIFVAAPILIELDRKKV